MNVPSSHIRESLKTFDTFFNKVSKSALLRDTGYSIHSPSNMARMVIKARSEMARIGHVSLSELPYIHSGSNGRNDCDNFSIVGCYILKLIHDVECREYGKEDEQEYAIFPMARDDIDHTQALCLTDMGWHVVDFITGETWKASDLNFKILQVG